ncbi:multidrug transporter subunit MdtA [Bordetella genomosp. 1]|uniref:Multidrug transporter subunit MdtA n=1 Tax=Bordetella genomosp. 1 TaxID=1395607 RepID=A0A261STJ8_9BORD|nr:MdtA/MuxA family multidrug efflux RND transporter periplasmic adaptor subunit [Bordetella genomosp. 1]MDQ8034226.1 MdtA/MuxA family multidrug efflux RND transporter periplasmic adaptor subunit [Bordetella sp.]OZI40709.1 multidrug transporter subunit MdtA [Bordetella genomosp. 1]OZI68905.1 multidrug transporter subunit MdtA [Bordetella genomosp. 1]
MSDISPAPSPSRRKKRLIAIVVVLLLVALAAWLIWRPAANTGGQGRRGGGMAGGPAAMMNMPVPVKVAAARSQDFDIVLRALGTVTAYNTVTVRSRVEGELVKVNFQEGQFVKAGDVLAQVDPRPYEVALAQAQGTQQQNQAQLENARRDLQRYQTLFKQDSIARQQLDTQAALVRQYEGTVKSDQAAVDNAKLQLTYSRITAPIAGRLGLRQVDQGNLVSSGDTNGLVVITQTDPISVLFTLPETQLPDVLAQLREGRTLQVQAYDRADIRQIATGELETVDNQIDVTTGTVKLKARFANADQQLFPNQFVNVRLLVERRANVTAIPTVAVQQGSVGSFVFVVQEDKTVAVRPLKLGTIDQGWVAVNEGIKPGEQVVVEGTDRLRTGSKVDVVATPENVPSTPGSSLGAGAPAGTSPATIKRSSGSGR